MSNVLIVFQATQEPTERSALAVGLGAVQAGGNIRLRHLAPQPSSQLAHQGYGTLQNRDLLWADTIVVGVETETQNKDLEEFTTLLQQLGKQDVLRGKRGWSFGPKHPCASVAYLNSVMQDNHLTLVKQSASLEDTIEDMNRIGQEIARG